MNASIMACIKKIQPYGYFTRYSAKKGQPPTMPKKNLIQQRAGQQAALHTGLKTSRAHLEAISARKRAEADPRGMDITDEELLLRVRR
jgi:hypothetical protein